jgi:Skp family chaperone for outer membrane proteins
MSEDRKRMTHAGMVSIAVAALLAAAPAAAQQAAPAPAAAATAAAGSKVGFVDTERVMRMAREPKRLLKLLEEEFAKREREIAAGPARDQERRRAAMLEDMNGVIRRIAEQENFDAVFIEAAYASPRIDLTDKVIKALDAAR